MKREDFEQGRKFRYGAKVLSFVAMPSNTFAGYIAHWFKGESGHEANVSNITDEGFHFETTVVNKEVSGFASFAELHAY